MGDMIAKGEVKNMIDLCYQTLALAEIDRTVRDQIAKNARAHPFAAAAGRPVVAALRGQSSRKSNSRPGTRCGRFMPRAFRHRIRRSRKALHYLLGRQQPFGGWMDPLQSFENFRTPFRETQMAVLALSSYFPLAGTSKGWNSPHIDRLSSDPAELLGQLDEVWDAPSPAVRKQIEAAAGSNDALIRQAAMEALGRLGVFTPCTRKLSEIPASWCSAPRLGRCGNPTAGTRIRRRSRLLGALRSQTTGRAGAPRACSRTFCGIGETGRCGRSAWSKLRTIRRSVRACTPSKAVAALVLDIRHAGVKEQIEDTLLAPLGKPQPEWVASNLDHAIYNLADENIRYLYNNWVPLLAREEDRERAVKGRLAVESRLADKFASVLEERSRKAEEGAAARAHRISAAARRRLRSRGRPCQTAPPVYNRIGNDIEQIAFFGESRRTYGARNPAPAGLYGRRNAPAGIAGGPAGPRHALCRCESHCGSCRGG